MEARNQALLDELLAADDDKCGAALQKLVRRGQQGEALAPFAAAVLQAHGRGRPLRLQAYPLLADVAWAAPHAWPGLLQALAADLAAADADLRLAGLRALAAAPRPLLALAAADARLDMPGLALADDVPAPPAARQAALAAATALAAAAPRRLGKGHGHGQGLGQGQGRLAGARGEEGQGQAGGQEAWVQEVWRLVARRLADDDGAVCAAAFAAAAALFAGPPCPARAALAEQLLPRLPVLLERVRCLDAGRQAPCLAPLAFVACQPDLAGRLDAPEALRGTATARGHELVERTLLPLLATAHEALAFEAGRAVLFVAAHLGGPPPTHWRRAVGEAFCVLLQRNASARVGPVAQALLPELAHLPQAALPQLLRSARFLPAPVRRQEVLARVAAQWLRRCAQGAPLQPLEDFLKAEVVADAWLGEELEHQAYRRELFEAVCFACLDVAEQEGQGADGAVAAVVRLCSSCVLLEAADEHAAAPYLALLERLCAAGHEQAQPALQLLHDGLGMLGAGPKCAAVLLLVARFQEWPFSEGSTGVLKTVRDAFLGGAAAPTPEAPTPRSHVRAVAQTEGLLGTELPARHAVAAATRELVLAALLAVAARGRQADAAAVAGLLRALLPLAAGDACTAQRCAALLARVEAAPALHDPHAAPPPAALPLCLAADSTHVQAKRAWAAYRAPCPRPGEEAHAGPPALCPARELSSSSGPLLVRARYSLGELIVVEFEVTNRTDLPLQQLRLAVLHSRAAAGEGAAAASRLLPDLPYRGSAQWRVQLRVQRLAAVEVALEARFEAAEGLAASPLRFLPVRCPATRLLHPAACSRPEFLGLWASLPASLHLDAALDVELAQAAGWLAAPPSEAQPFAPAFAAVEAGLLAAGLAAHSAFGDELAVTVAGHAAEGGAQLRMELRASSWPALQAVAPELDAWLATLSGGRARRLPSDAAANAANVA